MLDFKQQLLYGIRFFDIRIKHVKNKFRLYHGPINLKLYFDEFLEHVNLFLLENPSETVLVNVRQEQKDDRSTRTIRETLDYYLSLYPLTHGIMTTNATKLAEARGKFIIFYDYNMLDMTNTFDKQSKYLLLSHWALYNKWIGIRSHLNAAVIGDRNKFYITYLSGNGGAFPYFVASGHWKSSSSSRRLLTGMIVPVFKRMYSYFPRTRSLLGLTCILFEGTNVLTRDYISNCLLDGHRTVGIIMADFPGTSLIEHIIENNYVQYLNKS